MKRQQMWPTKRWGEEGKGGKTTAAQRIFNAIE